MTHLNFFGGELFWSDLCAGLAISLAHFLWQAVLIGLGVALAARALRQSAPAKRHNLYLGALVLLVFCPLVTFALLVRPSNRPNSAAPQPTVAVPDSTPRMPLVAPAQTQAGTVAQAIQIHQTPEAVSARAVAPLSTVAATPVFAQDGRAFWRDQSGRIMALYFVGVAIMIIRTLLGLQNARVLRRGASPIEHPEILSVLNHYCTKLNLRVVPPLAISARVAVPCVIGVLKPMIILPVAVLNELSPQQIGIILAHELGHLRRHDQWVSLFQRTVETALFFHPVVWMISRRLSREREMCCDDLVVAEGGDDTRTAYAALLVRVAELCLTPSAEPALAMVDRPSQLRKRIMRLLKDATPAGRLAGSEFIPQKRWLAAALLPMMAAAIFAWGLVGLPRPITAQQADPSDFQLRVVDESTGQPLAGAQLKVNSNDVRSTAVTDADGAFKIKLAEPFKVLDFSVTAPKHVPMRLVWRTFGDTPVKPPAGGYTLKLPQGVEIGGVVQDVRGKPIEAVPLYLNINPKNRVESSLFYRGNPEISVWDIPLQTDAAGHWTYDSAPAAWDYVAVRADHPDYFSPSFGKSLSDADALKKQTAVLVLDDGVSFAGTIRDSQGKPVDGAKVQYDFDRGSRCPETRSRADGSFSFLHARPDAPNADEAVTFLFSAKGLAPKVLRIPHAQASAGPIDVTLLPSKPIVGQVLDGTGKPAANVSIAITSIGRIRALGVSSIRTDDNGRFSLDGGDAPIEVDVLGRLPDSTVRDIALSTDVENIIRLHRVVTVHGSVVDAQSGQPITDGRVYESYSSADRPIWQSSHPIPIEAGSYRHSFDESGGSYMLRFEASGYTPVVSRVFGEDEGDITYDVKLARGVLPNGIIRTPDGKPAEGATIVAADRNTQVIINNGKFTSQTMTRIVTTGADGRYEFQPQASDDYWLIALHESGYLRISAKELAKTGSGDTTLQPWPLVEGTVRIGAAPAAGARVGGFGMLGFDRPDQPEPRVHMEFFTTADAQGKFSLKVAPELTYVGRYVQLREMAFTYAQPVKITPQPGRTVTVEIGGGGRAVEGTVVVPLSIAPRGTWMVDDAQLTAKADLPKVKWPADVQQMSNEQRKAWYSAWLQTEEGKAYRAALEQYNNRKRYAVVVADTGAFHVDDVQPGTYELDFRITDRANPPKVPEELARARTTVTIPPAEPDAVYRPIELREIEAVRVKSLRVGEAAPGFTATTFDGKQLWLADFRGRYVVLEFWATWCEPCIKDLPQLKTFYSKIAGNSRVVMIGLSFDEKADDAKKLVDAQKLEWTNAWLGSMESSSVSAAYGVHGIPSMWLIAPDGKVLARDLSGSDGIEQLIRLLSVAGDANQK